MSDKYAARRAASDATIDALATELGITTEEIARRMCASMAAQSTEGTDQHYTRRMVPAARNDAYAAGS